MHPPLFYLGVISYAGIYWQPACTLDTPVYKLLSLKKKKEWRNTTHGFQTYITPIVGAHWVVMAELKDFDSDIHAFQSNIKKFKSANAVVLHPGKTL
jgi:hypothetical protein